MLATVATENNCMAKTNVEAATSSTAKLIRQKQRAIIMKELYQLYSDQRPTTINNLQKRKAVHQQLTELQKRHHVSEEEEEDVEIPDEPQQLDDGKWSVNSDVSEDTKVT